MSVLEKPKAPESRIYLEHVGSFDSKEELMAYKKEPFWRKIFEQTDYHKKQRQAWKTRLSKTP